MPTHGIRRPTRSPRNQRAKHVHFINLTPGSSSLQGDGQSPTPVGGDANVSFNGNRVVHNLYMIDGGEDADRGGGGTTAVMPSIEAMAEFRTLTSNYDAEYGLSSAATMTTVLRSGTKQYHASAWEFFRNDDLDARNYFNLRSPESCRVEAQHLRLQRGAYGVPIATGTWGGSGLAAGLAAHMYFLHRAFPDIVGSEYTLRGLDYVLGTHPVSNVSYVSSVGAQSKLIAYGNNRADYSFIPGGLIPGVVIVQPDYPKLKDDWPFLWFENEYVVDTVTTFILAASAANALAR